MIQHVKKEDTVVINSNNCAPINLNSVYHVPELKENFLFVTNVVDSVIMFIQPKKCHSRWYMSKWCVCCIDFDAYVEKKSNKDFSIEVFVT